jgi:multiple sugar transport system permease protein
MAAQTPTVLPATIRSGSAAARLRGLLGPDWVLGWSLVAPVVAIVLALLAYPLVDAIFLSFQNRFIGQEGTWVGLQNYASFFADPNSPFPKAALVTVVFTGGAVIGKFFVGMAMAAVLNQDIPAKNFFRGLMFLPWAVPAVVSAYVWRFMFDTTGPINGMIAEFRLADDYIYFFNDA